MRQLDIRIFVVVDPLDFLAPQDADSITLAFSIEQTRLLRLRGCSNAARATRRISPLV